LSPVDLIELKVANVFKCSGLTKVKFWWWY